MGEISTRDRILDAAEELFAEQGFATSLRSITANAEVNLAAVNYHFGSKEALIQEVFHRRLGPLNAERVALLDDLENATGGEAPELESVVEAFVGPPLRMSHDPQGATFMRLFGHTLGQRDDRVLRMFAEEFRTVAERFGSALGRALPHLDHPEVLWRLLFMVGSMAHTMSLSDKLPDLTRGVCRPADVETLIRRLVPFVAGGMRAAAPLLETRGAS
jgi:AcrR family transcriptional regulator